MPGLGHDGVTVRNIPTALNAIGIEIDHLLEEVGPGAAFLCRLPFFARADCRRRSNARLQRIPDEIGIVYDQTTEEGNHLPYPAVRCKTGIKERYAMIGKMLASIAAGHAPARIAC